MSYFVWDADRILLPIYGPIALRWYSLMFLVGFGLGYWGIVRMARAEGKRTDFADSLLNYLVLGTIIGARLGHCLFYDPVFYLSSPLEILKIWEGGLASHGGYAGIITGMYLFGRANKDLGFWWVVDRVSILAVMTGGFIRIGNLFNSEIIGKVTNVPWAVIFKQVDSLPRHPAQIYESIGYFTSALILYLVYRFYDRTPPAGKVFGLAIAQSFLFRFVIEGYKENQVPFETGWTFNLGQLLSVPFVLWGVYLFFGWHQKKTQVIS